MSDFNKRIEIYTEISSALTIASNHYIQELILNEKPEHSGINGIAHILKIKQTPVFVKSIYLTDRELEEKNMFSTSNLFDLPMYYQYGVGSAGFGAWRELYAHRLTTNWVLTGACEHFPILYDWRILPITNNQSIEQETDDLEKSVQYWNNSSAVRSRLEAINHASYQIVLFLEYFPFNLHTWLSNEVKNNTEIETVLSKIEKQLQTVINFINNNGLYHFDAHFNNILTDGDKIYLSDFGLSLHQDFKLSEVEKNFLKAHAKYDICCAMTNLLHSIITPLYGKKHWENVLESPVTKEEKLPSQISPIFNKYVAIARMMHKFFMDLQHTSKLTPYPKDEINQIFNIGKI